MADAQGPTTPERCTDHSESDVASDALLATVLARPTSVAAPAASPTPVTKNATRSDGCTLGGVNNGASDETVHIAASLASTPAIRRRQLSDGPDAYTTLVGGDDATPHTTTRTMTPPRSVSPGLARANSLTLAPRVSPARTRTPPTLSPGQRLGHGRGDSHTMPLALVPLVGYMPHRATVSVATDGRSTVAGESAVPVSLWPPSAAPCGATSATVSSDSPCSPASAAPMQLVPSLLAMGTACWSRDPAMTVSALQPPLQQHSQVPMAGVPRASECAKCERPATPLPPRIRAAAVSSTALATSSTARTTAAPAVATMPPMGTVAAAPSMAMAAPAERAISVVADPSPARATSASLPARATSASPPPPLARATAVGTAAVQQRGGGYSRGRAPAPASVTAESVALSPLSVPGARRRLFSPPRSTSWCSSSRKDASANGVLGCGSGLSITTDAHGVGGNPRVIAPSASRPDLESEVVKLRRSMAIQDERIQQLERELQVMSTAKLPQPLPHTPIPTPPVPAPSASVAKTVVAAALSTPSVATTLHAPPPRVVLSGRPARRHSMPAPSTSGVPAAGVSLSVSLGGNLDGRCGGDSADNGGGGSAAYKAGSLLNTYALSLGSLSVPPHRGKEELTWSVSRTMRLCCEHEEAHFAGCLRLLDRSAVTSVTGAIELLNSGTLTCPEGLCAVYSTSHRSYFVLFRSDCRDLALAAFTACAESAFNAGLAALVRPRVPQAPVAAPQYLVSHMSTPALRPHSIAAPP